MERYDYYAAVKEDVKAYVINGVDMKGFADREELEEFLNDELWANDGVTGNGSGSYTFDAWKAEEYVCHNGELLTEALAEFDCAGENIIKKGAEWVDVTIRCYVLGQAIAAAIGEMEAAGEIEYGNEEEEEE